MAFADAASESVCMVLNSLPSSAYPQSCLYQKHRDTNWSQEGGILLQKYHDTMGGLSRHFSNASGSVVDVTLLKTWWGLSAQSTTSKRVCWDRSP